MHEPSQLLVQASLTRKRAEFYATITSKFFLITFVMQIPSAVDFTVSCDEDFDLIFPFLI